MKEIDEYFYAQSEFGIVKNNKIIILSKYTAYFRSFFV